MVGRILLIILLLLILLIFFVPYGVDAAYEEGVFSLRVKAGPLRIRLFPKKPLTEKQLARKKKKKEKAEAKKKAAEAEKPSDSKPKGAEEKLTVREKRRWDAELILDLLRIGARTIRRLFRSFSVDYFKLHYTVVGADPYNVALMYGRACAAVQELPALCGGVVRVKRSDIALGCDFTQTGLALNTRIVLSVQLYRFVHLAVALLVEYLIWHHKSRRSAKAAAAMEREDDNGRQSDQ